MKNGENDFFPEIENIAEIQNHKTNMFFFIKQSNKSQWNFMRSFVNSFVHNLLNRDSIRFRARACFPRPCFDHLTVFRFRN